MQESLPAVKELPQSLKAAVQILRRTESAHFAPWM
jgi:hypothetical protein